MTMSKEYQEKVIEVEKQQKDQQSLRNRINDLITAKGSFSHDNVIEHKRQRKTIDYVALSMEVCISHCINALQK